MEALAAGGGPLYGGSPGSISGNPSTTGMRAEMDPFADPRERALTYGIFGGTPRYLAAIGTEKASDLLVAGRLVQFIAVYNIASRIAPPYCGSTAVCLSCCPGQHPIR